MSCRYRARVFAALAGFCLLGGPALAETTPEDGQEVGAELEPASQAPRLPLDLHVTAAFSYLYNLTGAGPTPPPGTRENGPIGNPFHSEHNSLQVDELSFGVAKPALPESRVGFSLEVSYGATAGVLGQTERLPGLPNRNGGNDFWLGEAKLDVATPWRVDVEVGKFETHIGLERASAAENWHITRGLLFTTLQPIDQVGIRISGSCDCPYEWMVGAVNGFSPNFADVDDEKDVVWRIAYTFEQYTLSFGGEWGHDAESAGFLGPDDTQLLLDVAVVARQSDRMQSVLGLTYREVHVDGRRPYGLGVVLGNRVELNSRAALIARIEYGHADAQGATFSAPSVAGLPANLLIPGNGGREMDVLALTGTGEFRLFGDLLLRAELKYERVLSSQGGTARIFNAVPLSQPVPSPAPAPIFRNRDQVLAGIQLVYRY